MTYKNYGGRGIKLEWKTFEEFYNDMSDSYQEHIKEYGQKQTSLDRKDVNGNYCKDNCRWATMEQQANNKTTNVYIEYKGETYTLSQLDRKLGRKTKIISDRIKRGWNIQDAIEVPNLTRNGRLISYKSNYEQK